MKKIVSLCILISLLSCNASKNAKNNAEIETTHPTQTQNFKAEGRWVWVSSTFVTRGLKEPKISSPESRGYQIVIEFKENLIVIEKNGAVVAQVPYTLEQQSEYLQLIRVENPQDDFPFFIASGPVYINGNELIISGGYNDAGENQTYKREN